MFKKLLYILFLGFFSSAELLAVGNRILPYTYSQAQNIAFISNPAVNGVYHPLEFRTATNTYVGVLSNVGAFYGQVNASLKSDTSRSWLSAPRNVLGLSVFREKEGNYISRSRIYLNYSWHTGLTPKLSLSTGVGVGVFNYSVHSSVSGAGGSVWAWDGSIGVWLYGKTFGFGVSGSQLPSANPKWELSEISLTRYWSAALKKDFELNYKTIISLNSELFLYDSGWKSNVGVLIHFLKYAVGVNYLHQNGVALQAGLRNKLTIDSRYMFELMFGYQIKTLSKSQFNAQQVEVSLNVYRANRKSEENMLMRLKSEHW